MDDYTPIPLHRFSTFDAKAASRLFMLSKYTTDKIGANKDLFMYFLDTKSIFTKLFKDTDLKTAGIKAKNADLDEIEFTKESYDNIKNYMNDLKELMSSYLKIDEQIQKYDFQNRLMNKDLGVGRFGRHDSDKYGKGKGGQQITYDEYLKTTVLGEIQEQYECFTSSVCEFALGLTHKLYWKNDGRTLEHRPGRILDKCFKRALNLVRPIISAFNDELVKEYGNILDGVYEIKKTGLQQ